MITASEISLEGVGETGEDVRRDFCGWPEGKGNRYEMERVLIVILGLGDDI